MGKPKRDDSHVVENVADDLIGGSEFKRSKLSYFSGFGAVKGLVGGISSTGREAVGRTGGMLASLRRADRSGVPVSDDITDGHRRFLESMRLNGRTQDHVSRGVVVTYNKFIICLIIMIIAAAISVYFIHQNGITSSTFLGAVFEIGMQLFLVPVLGMFMLAFAYTNWQLRTMRLEPISNFFRSGDMWPKHTMTRRASTGVMKICLLMAVLVMATVSGPGAFAQSVQAPQNAEGAVRTILEFNNNNDLFMRMLSYVMPGVGPIPTSEVVDSNQFFAIKTGFRVFCNILLFLGGVVFGWQFLSAVIQATRDGTMLGKQFHQVWAPVRMVVGFGMLAPMANGLCAAQIAVLYVVAVGSNMGNAIWAPYVSTITLQTRADFKDDAISTITAWNVPTSIIAIDGIFAKELCNAVLKNYQEKTKDKLSTDRYKDDVSFQKPNRSWYDYESIAEIIRQQPEIVYYRADYGQICGKAEIQFTNPETVYNTAVMGANNIGNGGIIDLTNASAGAIMGNHQAQALNAVVVRLRELATRAAQSYIDNSTPDAFLFKPGKLTDDQRSFIDTYMQVREAYMDKMYTAAAKVYDAAHADSDSGGKGRITQLREQASKEGWAGAGMYYISLARLQNAIYERAAEAPTFSAVNFGLVSNNPDLAKYLTGDAATRGVMTDYIAFQKQYASQIQQNSPLDGMSAANDETTTFGKYLTSASSAAVAAWEFDTSPNPLNPMQDMIEMGNKLIGGGLILFTASTAMEVGGELFTDVGKAAQDITASVPDPRAKAVGLAGSGMKIAGKALAGFGSIGAFLGISMVIVGIVFAFVLPMIPYIYVTFFVAAMAILVAEALVAAPIWAFMHIRMDGEQFVHDVQKPGYMIAFNLLLRPPMMVFALILSYVIYGATAYYMSYTFMPAMMGLSASNGIGVLGFFAMIIMVTYLHFLTAVRSFGLITQLPDRVSRWFNSSAEGTTEESDSRQVMGFLYGTSKSAEQIVKPLALVGKSGDTEGGGQRSGGRQSQIARKPGPTQSPNAPTEV